ncbi:endonuclease/exonuclease/phosphatase family protein [Halobaculum sp. MBLA0147]|uniref:endonuclease/exonuclease/phosphatase family protein n=1 Tax=Halobaculum sp. MBLA0147 TaxID=3079934 RepID=UPI0035259765
MTDTSRSADDPTEPPLDDAHDDADGPVLAADVPPVPDAAVRIVTYNVRYAQLDEGAAAWDDRRERVAAQLRALAPDAVALQECWYGQLEDLLDRLDGYEAVAFPDENGAHTPILVQAGRLGVVDGGVYGVAPDGELGVVAWDASYPRVVTRATLRVREPAAETEGEETTPTLDLHSVHLDHEGAEARREGARVVCERLADGPAVVAGDCNCLPDSPPYRVFTEEYGLADSRAVAASVAGPAETYVGFGGRAVDEDGAPRAKRLDYAFCRGVSVRAHRTVQSARPPAERPSDHRPVVVDLRIDGDSS